MVKTIHLYRKLGTLYKDPPLSESGLYVPRRTLNSVLSRLGDKEPTLENCFPLQKKSLLSQETVCVLQDIICKRDEHNNGLSRKETLEIIAGLGNAKSFRQDDNHLDYLI